MRPQIFLAAAGALVGFFLDQYAKSLISRLPSGATVASWGPFGIEQLFNRAVFIWVPLSGPVLLGTTVIIFCVVLGVFAYIVRKKYWTLVPGLLLVLSGGASNLIDRSIYHRTVDYLRVFGLVGNIADILIVFGLLWVLSKLQHLQNHE